MTLGCQIGCVCSFRAQDKRLLLHLDPTDASTVFSDTAGTILALENDNVRHIKAVNDTSITFSTLASNLFYRFSGTESINDLNTLFSTNPNGFSCNSTFFGGDNEGFSTDGITMFMVFKVSYAEKNINHPYEIKIPGINHLIWADNRTYECWGFDNQKNLGIIQSDNVSTVYALYGSAEGNGKTEVYVNDPITPVNTSHNYDNDWKNGMDKTTLPMVFYNAKGKFGEVIIYNYKRTQSEFETEFNALKTKWGVT